MLFNFGGTKHERSETPNVAVEVSRALWDGLSGSEREIPQKVKNRRAVLSKNSAQLVGVEIIRELVIVSETVKLARIYRKVEEIYFSKTKDVALFRRFPTPDYKTL